METTSRTSSQKEGKKKGSSEANLIEERSQILNAVNESFKRKIARANKKYEEEEATSSKEESSAEETVNTSKKKAKMVSFNSRIPRKKDTLGAVNAAYDDAIKRSAPNSKDVHLFSDSDDSTILE